MLHRCQKAIFFLKICLLIFRLCAQQWDLHKWYDDTKRLHFYLNEIIKLLTNLDVKKFLYVNQVLIFVSPCCSANEITLQLYSRVVVTKGTFIFIFYYLVNKYSQEHIKLHTLDRSYRKRNLCVMLEVLMTLYVHRTYFKRSPHSNQHSQSDTHIHILAHSHCYCRIAHVLR